jgi:hypothetical protein
LIQAHCRDRLRSRAVLISDTATTADHNAKPATPKKNQVASVIGQNLSAPLKNVAYVRRFR